MRKIYTRSVFEFNESTGQYEVNDNESHYHFIDDNAPIMLMKGNDGGNTTTVSNTAPWSGVQPYLNQAYADARTHWMGQVPQYYQGEQVAPFSQDTLSSFDATRQRALAGSPLNADATGLLDRTLKGDYLYGGSGFNAALDAAKNKIIPDVEGRFAQSGRYGSGLARTAEASGIGDAFAGLYGDERNRQMDAARIAPTVADMDYNDADRLGRVGQQEDIRNQSEITGDINKWNFTQNVQRNNAADWIRLLQGQYGGSTTQSQLGGGNDLSPWARYLLQGGAGAAKGYATGGPWGAAEGGGAGLLSAYGR